MDLPEPFKFIKRYLIQANQCERFKQPLIAYYLRLYAVGLALKLPSEQRNASCMQFIGRLMDELEKLKGELDILDKDADRVRVEEYAAQLFEHADQTDREGKANKLTALGFSAASVIFECLANFGALEPEIVERIRYARWKAAEISKALKNGQVPIPGPYNQSDSNGGLEKELPPSDDIPEHKTADDLMQDGGSLSTSTTENFVQPSFSNSLPMQPTSSDNTFVPASRRFSLDEEKRYYAMIVDAEKKVSQALASLRFKDWNGAESLLLSALERVRVIKDTSNR